MSCGVLLFGNIAVAVKCTREPGAGLLLSTVRLIDVGLPSDTVTVVVAGVTVPILAVIFALHTPVTVLTGLTRPPLLILAQVVDVSELQSTLPVRSLVDPSL